MTEWYSPASFRFTKAQIRWLISHLLSVREGYWPAEHKYSGYLYIGGSSSKGNKAPFITPCEIAAELEARMEKCGLDGWMLEFVYGSDSEDKPSLIYKIHKYTGLECETIIEKINSALGFCQGYHRNTQSYKKYLSSERHRSKKK